MRTTAVNTDTIMIEVTIQKCRLFSSKAGNVNEYWKKFLSFFKEAQENNITKKCVNNRSRKHNIPLDKKSY